MARQRRYFRNLVQLPLARLRLPGAPTSSGRGCALPERWGDGRARPAGRLTMQLEEYDAVPVERTVGFVFSFRNGTGHDRLGPDRRREAALRGHPRAVGPDRDHRRARSRACSASSTGDDQRVGRRPSPRRCATASTRSTARCRSPGPASVVVYSVQNPRVLASFTDVPGGALEHLGALTFPTYAEDGRSAGGLDPDAGDAQLGAAPAQPFLGRITRHELSHIAIGVRDDGAPAWVSEGIAEYLGAREIPVRDADHPHLGAEPRPEPRSTAMPVSKDFNNTDQEWHYALSWMACDYIADDLRRGPAVGAGRRDAQRRRGHRATPTRTACSSRCSATTAASSPAARRRGSATSTAEVRPAQHRACLSASRCDRPESWSLVRVDEGEHPVRVGAGVVAQGPADGLADEELPAVRRERRRGPRRAVEVGLDRLAPAGPGRTGPSRRPGR